jgi:hypothetical protein
VDIFVWQHSVFRFANIKQASKQGIEDWSSKKHFCIPRSQHSWEKEGRIAMEGGFNASDVGSYIVQWANVLGESRHYQR